jgi:uncharacterized protein (DUF362 family)
MTGVDKKVPRDSRVAIAKAGSGGYGEIRAAEAEAIRAIARTSMMLGWSDEKRGPLGKVIPEGARVLIKPNLVMHENQSPCGLGPLVTHPSLIRATVLAALQAGTSEVIVGDAPLQGCDFDQLLSATGLDEWANDLMSAEPRFLGIHDFRRTTCKFINGMRMASENLISEARFVLFDLGCESLLEPVTDTGESFRVTCYDPRLMSDKHAPGRHQYLVARDVIEADVIINLPKLKTHKKAGVTCALKNLIGINGNKEYLPHHRAGGSESGGDCYPGASPIKRALEYALDRHNMAASLPTARLWRELAVGLNRISALAGDPLGVEGSWSGNDTVWRTCLDLNRILLYGREDGSLADEVQRRVIHIVDAVVAGQGDGPLSPQPLPMGLIFAGSNAAAVDWVGAHLLGYDPRRIPIARESFAQFRWPITLFTPDDVTTAGDLGAGNADQLLASREIATHVIYPAGWLDAAKNVKADEDDL